MNERRRRIPDPCPRARRVALAIGLLVLSPAAWAVGAQATGTIAGTVVAGGTGQPVPNAVVLVDGESLAAVTNGVGRFEIAGAPPGAVGLTVQAAGYLELRVPDVQVVAGSATAVTVELVATPNYLERVQVTASKAPLSIGEIAAQADVVERAEIDERGDQRLTQAIAHVPGVIVSTQAGSFESVMLRGLPRDGNEFTSTLLLIDGVPQTDSRNSSRVINLPIHDAGSIEVVRGPNSALYGRTAIGGAVNVRTGEPTAEHESDFDLGAGGFGFFKGAARASGPVDDWGGYFVSASSERNSGFYTGPSEFTVDQTSVFAKLTFVPDSKSFGMVSANRVVSAQSLPTNEPIIAGRFLSDIDPRFDRLSDLNVAGVNYRQNEGRFTANYTRQFTDEVRLVNVFGYRQIQYKFIDSGDITGAPFDLANTVLTQYPFDLQTDEDIFYGESRLETDFSAGVGRDVVHGRRLVRVDQRLRRGQSDLHRRRHVRLAARLPQSRASVQGRLGVLAVRRQRLQRRRRGRLRPVQHRADEPSDPDGGRALRPPGPREHADVPDRDAGRRRHVRRVQPEAERDRQAAAGRCGRGRERVRPVLAGVPSRRGARAACVPATTRST